MRLPFELRSHSCWASRMRGRLWHQSACIRRLVGGSGAVSHVSHRSTLPPPPDRVGRLTGTAAVSVHATSIAGGTQRDPEGTSREPRRRCYGHRRGISLPKALYQNAARMSRGAEGTTEASGRRDQAGLAARKRRVGAVRGAVPAQNEPKSDRPRAKTPMNRRKSRLPADRPHSSKPPAQTVLLFRSGPPGRLAYSWGPDSGPLPCEVVRVGSVPSGTRMSSAAGKVAGLINRGASKNVVRSLVHREASSTASRLASSTRRSEPPRLQPSWVRLFFVDGPRGFCQRHGQSYLTRRRRGGEGGGGGLLTGRAISSAYRWAWCRWYSRVVEVPLRIEVAAGFVAPGASEPPRLQPSWPPGGSGPAHG